jgi:hypothetical protein
LEYEFSFHFNIRQLMTVLKGLPRSAYANPVLITADWTVMQLTGVDGQTRGDSPYDRLQSAMATWTHTRLGKVELLEKFQFLGYNAV